MRPLFYQILSIIALFLCETVFAQRQKLSDYYLIQRQYENRAENDSSALPFVRKRIFKAKREKNDLQLYIGYKDARYHSPDGNVKLKYADSTIAVAVKLKNDSLLSSAYLSKGVVFYFNFKKYKLALNEYLKAFEKNRNSTDPYYTNKINYHIGVVRSYVGYYQEALGDFESARKFFECEIRKDIHPNLIFGNQRGYYNTLHQMAVCYRNLKDHKKADSLVKLGLNGTYKNPDYLQEYSYFLKEQGINSFFQKDYPAAIRSLQSSLQGMIKVNDFAWLTVCYAYLGRAKMELGSSAEAVLDFEKVDSIFSQAKFVHPEVRGIYEDLIDYYGKQNNPDKALYYTSQLLKVDHLLGQDFIYLSSKLHKDYDTNKLLREQDRLERGQAVRRWSVITVVFLSVFGSLYVFLRIRSRKKIPGKNTLLGIDFGAKVLNPMEKGTYRIRYYNEQGISKDSVEDILHRLDEFEANKEFLQSKITLESLADRFEVTDKHLSGVIIEHKAASFNRYLSELRIGYITDKLLNDPKYLKYTSTALAKECGIASRSNFSGLFKEINGITFTDFINKRKEELSNETV
ncbi:AraC family transcriptional regulator [Chryseobacterium culicis]|uniref:AraC family transcriptional regulator n=1 Tax=Chryseobacterium culicis TaxID=680127 RepID=UPI00289C4386|nr:AraC family transcriptional regulator [Chryseobacterium culicis]